MDNNIIRTAIGFILAGIGGATAYLTTSNVVVSIIIFLSWGVSGWLFAYIWTVYPKYLFGDGVDQGRWDGIGAGVVAVVLFVGIRVIPIPAGYKLAVILLLIGVWTIGYFTATLSMIERQTS